MFEKESDGNTAARYRDWGTLKYWFRGVEKFAPWVNKIFFITWGHLPKWLNTSHPKLRIVNHKEFIPEKYLPTFNSNTIELNLHRIEELSEQFVLFNDDMFIINNVSESDFFSQGKPVDQFLLNAIAPSPQMPIIPHTIINNLRIINKYFNKKDVFKNNLGKIFNLKYGAKLGRTLLLSPWNRFTGFDNPHLPQSHLKSTFDLLWEKEYEDLDGTCVNKFRKYNDLNHWLMRYWNLCCGNFSPRSKGFGKYFNITETNNAIKVYLTYQQGKTICINDSSFIPNIETVKAEVNNSFDKILSEKSSFEV